MRNPPIRAAYLPSLEYRAVKTTVRSSVCFLKKLVTLRNNQKEFPSQILVILFLLGTNTEGIWTFLYSNCFAGGQRQMRELQLQRIQTQHMSVCSVLLQSS